MRFKPHEMEELKTQLLALLASGRISPLCGNEEDYAVSGAFFVKTTAPDRHGVLRTKYRLVCHFVQINAITKCRTQEMPCADFVIERVGRSYVFSKTDLLSGYFQLAITEAHRRFAAFSTPFGTFQWNVTAMGLVNAGVDFQRVLSEDLNQTAKLWDTFSHYVDDVLIHSSDRAQHMRDIKEGLTLLSRPSAMAGRVPWYLSVPKSTWAVDTIELLGHVVRHGAVGPDPAYLCRIADLPSPNDARQLRAVLGVLSFYRRYVPHFALMVQPLFALIVKGARWEWSGDHERRLREICTHMTSATSLVVFNPRWATRVTTDGSLTGVGATLEQRERRGLKWAPVYFFSRALTAQESRRSPHFRELVGIHAACKRWRDCLRQPFILRCDCSALQSLFTLERDCEQSHKMLMDLETFPLNWVHLPGVRNATADALSRIHPRVDTDASESPHLRKLMSTDTESPDLDPVIANVGSPESTLAVLEASRGPPSTDHTAHSAFRRLLDDMDMVIPEHPYQSTCCIRLDALASPYTAEAIWLAARQPVGERLWMEPWYVCPLVGAGIAGRGIRLNRISPPTPEIALPPERSRNGAR
jgi:hypothetical protein